MSYIFTQVKEKDGFYYFKYEGDSAEYSVPVSAVSNPDNARIANWLSLGNKLTPDEVIPLVQMLKDYAKAKRKEVEEGGMLFNNIPIATDPDSQRKVLGAAVKAHRDPSFTTKFNYTGDKFFTLTALMAIDLGDAMATHISKAFDTQDESVQMINAGVITTTRQIDSLFVSRMK